MQLKFKKVTLLTTIIVYCASFLIQSNLAFFQTWAAEVNTPRVNLVAILVDNRIYDSISWPLQWYASSYVQQQLSDTKALVMPLNLSSVSAYDIHRMMENIYFDWLKDVNSSLIWMIMVWDIPLPVVNQDWYVFPTVYPYVDFEDQKYVRDSDSQYFVSNNNPWWQAEIWHWLINYWTDAKSYIDFFEKIKKYVEKPDEFIWDAFWYEDFIASKEWFLNENYPYYRNKIMFWEDLSYQRYSTLMKKMFYWESTDNSVEVIDDLWWVVEDLWWDASEIFWSIDADLIQQLKDQWTDGMHTTKMIQQEIEDSFLADYDDLFSNTSLSTMRENVLAGWRWQRVHENADEQATLLANVDNSASMIQLKDTMYLWNQNLQWLLENLNELMEKMIDKKIEDEKYSMDIVIPIEYKKVTWKRIDFKCRSLESRYENFYFGNNARYIDSAQDLSIYRWTYRNLANLSGITYDSLLEWENPIVGKFDKTDVKLKSIWGSYDIFSNQAEWNRWYTMINVEWDLDIYDENKTVKKKQTSYKSLFGRLKKRTWPETCKEDSKKKKDQCEELHDFAKRWWWWASSINLISESVSKWRYELDGYVATDSRRPIYGMWWFQSLMSWKDEWMSGKWWVNGTWTWPQRAATSFKSYIKYSSPTQRNWWGKTSWMLIGKWYEIYENHTPDVHMNFADMDYWNLWSDIVWLTNQWKFSRESAKIFNINRSSSKRILKCWWSEEYSYKVISSVSKHVSTTEDEINWIDRDKYWESWTLWIYYRDIKDAYSGVNSDMMEIISEFSGLNSSIKSNIEFINGKIQQLDGEWNTLLEVKKKISSIEDSILSIESEIAALESEKSWLEIKLDYYQSNQWEEDYSAEISSLQDRIRSIESDISWKELKKSEFEWQMNIEQETRWNSETKIWDILKEVSDRLLGTWWEKEQLTDIYRVMLGLYVENIISVMEYIIYVEGWNPEDYYLTGSNNSDNLLKIWFLPSWMSEIKDVENSIKLNSRNIINYYSSVYSWIMVEQKAWHDLANKLKEISDENWENIDRVTSEVDGILTISDTDEDWEETVVTLTWWTARVEMNNLFMDLGRVWLLFWKLVEEDKVGPAVEVAAKADKDFLRRLLKKWIKFQEFSQEDWITEYAKWAKWDGYDSDWARINHDLLLWVSEHMSWMNVLTPDRPIDSPRYVSMQSIAWGEIKLIYPDLFKVEVFVLTWQDKNGYDIHELLTWGQIKEKLIKYLSGKADEYNKILETEYKKADIAFDGKKFHYNRLKTLGFNLATPEKTVRPYTYFTYKDFEDALWWSWMLDVISEMLYYQSLTNKKKLSTWWVADDIDLIKKSFSLNDKRELVLKDYLTERTWEELKTIKNPLLVIPTYELSWYEVAYINSDGKDYIIPTEEDVAVSNNTKVDAKIRRHQPIQQEKNFEEECQIPLNWKLPIFKLEWLKPTSPWFEWFKCRWKHTLQEPFKIEMTFDRSLWEVIVWSWFVEFMKSIWKSIFSETEEELTQWWDQMTKYADSRDSLLSWWTWYDADKAITQMQVEAENHNMEVIAGWTNVSNISRNIKISNSNALLSDSNPSSLLKIESISEIGNIQVEFMWTWDWCIIFDGSTLCDGAKTRRTFNPKTNPFSWLVETAHRAWKAALDIKINWGWWYIEKVLKYTVSPSELDNFEVKIWDEQTVAWMISPVEVIWYDKHWNRADWWLEKFDFSVSQWEFLVNWSYKTGFSTNDFRDLRFYYRAPLELEWNKALIEISRHNNPSKEVVVKPNNPYEQPLVDAAPVVWLNKNKILEWKNNLVANVDYRLSNGESIYVWWKLSVWKLQRLDIEIKEWGKLIDVDSQILVTSQNWLVYVWQVQKDEEWNDVFFETSKNYISWWMATIFYYPSTVAWEEVINIDIPWLETRVINLSIKPAPLANMQLVLEKDVLDLWDTMDIELFLSDSWWNLIDSNKVVSIYYDEDKVEFVNPNNWSDWVIEVVANNWYGKYEVVWTWAWLAYFRLWNEFYYFNVDKHIFPDSGLNIMYLNYFWNDWWNQWWYLSDNNKHVETIMSKSNKIITTTTQLVSEDKIKKMLWKIEPWFKIWDPDSIGTFMTIDWNHASMIIWDMTSMNATFPSLTWMEATPISFDVALSNKGNWNYAFFMPNDSKYSMDKNGVLYNSGERVVWLANGDVTFQLSSSFMNNGDNIWKVIYKWVNYGNLVIHYPKFSPNINNFVIPWERYLVNETFTNGSTYKLSSVWVFDLLSNFELNTNYKSIQNSDELEEKIWFLWDFKNITLFAEWEIVWEATRKFWSEFVINLWDPVLSRKSLNEKVYGTEYDGWIWQEIYADPEGNIFWTYQIDFNWDGNKDLLVVYLNGSIKLAKNYWWTPDLRNMQELMRIAVPIQNVFVWDADGRGGEDIIVLTTNNQLRAYLNNGGVFNVDGNVACLNQNVFWWEVSSTPSSLEWIYQIFVEDMNNDDKVDVITYDNKWYIKVFYGWSTKDWPNYLSKETYACDTWWYDREARNITVVDALWITIDWSDVFDNSMLHRVWMTKPVIEISEAELEEYGIHIDLWSLEKKIKVRERWKDGSINDATREIMDVNDPMKPNYKFDLSEASEKFIDEDAKYVNVTLYENDLIWWWDWDNYVFAPSSYLDPNCAEDKWSVWKNYRISKWWPVLQDWDIVTVRVTVKASNASSFQWAFWDIIQWPWNLYYDENKILKSIRFLHNQRNAVIKQKDGNFAYIIDWITLWPSETMVFEYDLEYRSIPLRKMDITYETFYSNDNLPDIKLQSVDWCEKDFDAYINGWWSFWKQRILLQDMIDETYYDEDGKTEDYAQDVINVWSDVNQLPWIVGDKISRVSLLRWYDMEISDDEEGKKRLESVILQKIEEGWLESLNMNLNIDLSIFEEQTDAIEDIIDDITKWMCNGFQFWWTSNCKWLPVPFNQAFLAPWKYHLFWCWDLPMWPLEKWLPVFFFPGTLKVWPVDVPIPWWMKAASDKFLRVPGWNPAYTSFIRIYAAPTLTAQLWIGICLWPYAAAERLKSPWADIGGNCIVFAVKPQCKNDEENPTNKESPYESYSDFVEEVRDSGICLQSQKWPQVTQKWYNSSPTRWVSYWAVYKGDNSPKYSLSIADNDYVDYSISADLWIINLEREAYTASDDGEWGKNSIIIWNVDILWGEFSVNKIKWWIQQWLRKILIDKWLDPQIRYILNQLTKMHINILWPDLSDLMGDDLMTLYNISLLSGGSVSMGEKSNSFDDVKNYYWDFIGNEGRVIKNIWNEIWWVFDDYTSKVKTSQRYWISNQSIDEFNDKIWNPFEALASLMNQSNIINISTEPLTVKVPMIFSEDINEYEFYLNQRLEENQAILDSWKTMLDWLLTNCAKLPENERDACKAKANENLASFIEFEQWDWPNMVNRIYTNLMILQEYRNFPFEIYEWIHVIDRYMSEIASLINNTVWYLSYWVVANSERFVWYIDAITLMLNIIKTYQLIIDFPVERSEKCGNCAKDTYDQYSCKLSFLCDSIQLPIIQIPNFKLPNITLDFSNIDIWLDVILPEFNFQPIKINLPDLPNLPEPPSIWANIKLFDLPNIPILPEPPTLPELPSFIPEVEIELPILPPAPELPELPNKIEGIIKLADVIGKIYCIVKKQFWMVWEMSLKSKIEQITQRTYEVKWIDTIMDFTNRSAAPLKNYWVDYEVSSYVDLNFTMSDFYDYLDVLTKWINNLSETAARWSNEQVSKIENNPIVDLRDSVSWINWQIEIWMINSAEKDFEWLTSDEINYVDYDRAKNRLNEVLTYFKWEAKNTTFADSLGWDITKIENEISKPSVVVANTEWIDNMKDEIMNYLDNEKMYYDDLANLINNDYDGFLAKVDSQDGNREVNKASDDKLLTFNVQLFNLDPSTKETIKAISKTNPYRSLVENKQEIIEWYRNAINSNTSESLWLTEKEYLVLRNNISSMKNQISTLYSIVTPASSTKLIAKNGNWSSVKTLVATPDIWERIWSNMKSAKVVDPAAFSDWIYEKMIEWLEAWKLTKVVNSDSFVEEIWGNFYDTNHFWSHDIILRDENSIYKKCASQTCANWGNHFGWYYMERVNEVPYEETWISFGSDTRLKIADWDVEVKNWKVVWQSYDILSFSWDLSDADAYLIKLVERIDHSYEKNDYNSKAAVSYILALPIWVELSDLYEKEVKLELIKDKSTRTIQKIEDLYWSPLVEVVYYDSQKDIADIIISNVERKWYYGRISALDLKDDTYYINSPWSNQIVAWKQAVWDDQAPISEQQLFRPSVQEVVSEWDELEWYVWTKYELNITWKDNVALSYINVSQDGEILDEKYTSNKEDTLKVYIDMHFYHEMETFDLLWIDQFGNKTEKVVTVTYSIPTIKLVDIAKNPDGETVSITAELSQDIDEWNVSFQRRRANAWKTMRKKYADCADLPIWPEMKIIIWSGYAFWNQIAMYDTDESVIALLNPDTSEITIQTGYVDSYEVNVKVINSAVLHVCNKSTKEAKFSVSIPTDSCLKIEAENYTVADLPKDWNMWMFNGWMVVHKDWNNILLASPTCHLYSEYGLEWTYSYDRESDAVVLTLYEPSDIEKSSPIRVRLKTKTFLPN